MHAAFSPASNKISDNVISNLNASHGGYPSCLGKLQILDLQFTHQFTQSAELESFKGGIWHGVFGCALKEIDEAAYQCLFSSTSRTQPWRLIAPRSTKQFFRDGDSLTATITLFNDAIEYTPACAEAIIRMGELGLGARRSHARTCEINGHVGDLPKPLAALMAMPDARHCGIYGNAIFQSLSHSMSLSQALPHTTNTQIESIALHLVSPLSLKQSGTASRTTPAAESVVRRLIARLAALLPADEGGLLSANEKRQLLCAAATLAAHSVDVTWADWARYSGRQKSTMPFGGLQGTLFFSGDADAIALVRPWLGLAERVGLGSKTTFGLGHIQLMALDNTSSALPLDAIHNVGNP